MDEPDWPEPDRAERGRRRLRVIGAVAASVAVVLAGGAFIALDRTVHASASGGSQLAGVTWRGSEPAFSVVFDDHTVRTSDGCLRSLRTVTVTGHRLVIGSPIGPQAVCGGTPGWPPPTVAAFDQVVDASRLAWQREGNTLRLTDAQGNTLELHADGPAPEVAGQTWMLWGYTDQSYDEHHAGYPAARLRIENGKVQASDLCNEISGSASVSDTTITFRDLRSTERDCAGSTAPVDEAVDHLLSGTVEYSIMDDQLMLYDRAGPYELIYQPGS